MSLAIAYNMKRRQQKASGGDVCTNCKGGGCEMCMAGGGYIANEDDRYTNQGVHSSVHTGSGKQGTSSAGLAVKRSKQSKGSHADIIEARAKHQEKLDELRSMPNPKLMAEGGDPYSGKNREDFEKGVHAANGSAQKPGIGHMGSESRQTEYSGAGHAAREAVASGNKEHNKRAKFHHERVLNQLREMPSPKLKAEGGDVDDSDDMIGRIMSKRMSKGGQVANESEPDADFMPNEFDELALSDDLESSYTGENSGDEIGNEQEDEDRKDMISKIMMKRRKQTNPRPA